MIASTLHPGHGIYSAIDLTMWAWILLDFYWKVWDDLCVSDHFPVIVKFTEVELQQRTPRWLLIKANWYSFQSLCHKKFSIQARGIQEPIKSFTDVLTGLAEESVLKTSAKPNCRTNPWFDENCKKSYWRWGGIQKGLLTKIPQWKI